MLARTSLRSLLRPVSRTSATSARWYSAENPTPEETAKHVEETVEKVETAAEDVVKKVTDLEAQVKELKSQLTYGRADFINLQRRTEQEKASTKDFAIQGFASDLLSTVDILTAALKHVNQPIPEDNKDLVALFNGVEMTKQELIKTLAKHGVVQFDPTGEKFDPNKHEALFQAPVAGKEPGTVLECQKTGYMIKSRTLRPAQVGVVQDTS
ncbi:GrpE, mitochondrial [Naganishia albida]|nr:GrpE, mitochondrial [Naganishia albida]